MTTPEIDAIISHIVDKYQLWKVQNHEYIKSIEEDNKTRRYRIKIQHTIQTKGGRAIGDWRLSLFLEAHGLNWVYPFGTITLNLEDPALIDKIENLLDKIFSAKDYEAAGKVFKKLHIKQ